MFSMSSLSPFILPARCRKTEAASQMADLVRFMSVMKSPLGQLRKSSGYSLALCKQALEANDNDVEKAQQWLKEQALAQGWSKANKLNARETSQGLVGLMIKGKVASMIELNCETDFVSRNENFQQLLKEISTANVSNAPKADTDEIVSKLISGQDLKTLSSESGKSLADLVALAIGQIGENITLSRGLTISAPEGVSLAGLTHPNKSLQIENGSMYFGKFGALVAYSKTEPLIPWPKDQNESTISRNFCQHVIGMSPQSLGDITKVTPADPDADDEDDEPKVEDQDPDIHPDDADQIIPEEKGGESSPMEAKIPQDFMSQEFLIKQSHTAGQYMLETGIIVKDFHRFELGQKTEVQE